MTNDSLHHKGSQDIPESDVDIALASLVQGVENLLQGSSDSNKSGPTGGLTLDEANKFFPALVDTDTLLIQPPSYFQVHNYYYNNFITYNRYLLYQKISAVILSINVLCAIVNLILLEK